MSNKTHQRYFQYLAILYYFISPPNPCHPLAGKQDKSPILYSIVQYTGNLNLKRMPTFDSAIWLDKQLLFELCVLMLSDFLQLNQKRSPR